MLSVHTRGDGRIKVGRPIAPDMDCPRCDASLVVYSFRERRALGCEDCGYVGVEVDHHVERRPEETWTEALERFARGRSGSTADDDVEPAIVPVED